MDKTIFWDIRRPLSYNCMFNFIVGNRGGGKTYGCKKYVINNFINKHEQFIYVRRFKEEFKDIGTFYNDLDCFGDEYELKSHNGRFICNGETMGYYIPLSTAKIKKSVAYPDVTTIIFDEFILDRGYYHYIPDEVTAFLEFFETVARMRDNVKVFFLSNAVTVTNPYFLYFDLKLPKPNKIKRNGDILVEFVAKDEFIKEKQKTRFGQLIKDTPYGDYAINNEFLRDNEDFIEKKANDCKYYFTINYKGQILGVWLSKGQGKLYVSFDTDTTSHFNYALTKDDHTPNTMLIASLTSSRPFVFFKQNFQMGNVYFETMNIKNIVYEIMKMCNLR